MLDELLLTLKRIGVYAGALVNDFTTILVVGRNTGGILSEAAGLSYHQKIVRKGTNKTSVMMFRPNFH